MVHKSTKPKKYKSALFLLFTLPRCLSWKQRLACHGAAMLYYVLWHWRLCMSYECCRSKVVFLTVERNSYVGRFLWPHHSIMATSFTLIKLMFRRRRIKRKIGFSTKHGSIIHSLRNAGMWKIFAILPIACFMTIDPVLQNTNHLSQSKLHFSENRGLDVPQSWLWIDQIPIWPSVASRLLHLWTLAHTRTFRITLFSKATSTICWENFTPEPYRGYISCRMQ